MPTEINYNSILQKHVQNNHPLAQQANPASMLAQASSNPAIGAMKEAVELATREKDKEIARLKLLISTAFHEGWYNSGNGTYEADELQHFKQTHNL